MAATLVEFVLIGTAALAEGMLLGGRILSGHSRVPAVVELGAGIMDVPEIINVAVADSDGLGAEKKSSVVVDIDAVSDDDGDVALAELFDTVGVLKS